MRRYNTDHRISGTPVDYKSGGAILKGYIAYDTSIKKKRPSILVVHEWWGHNEYARKRARMLAELGYTALAVDMYGEGKQAKHPKDAARFSSELMRNQDIAEKRFMEALSVLKNHETVDGSKIAAIGYCFGSGVVLHMARRGVDMDGVVSFHGSLATNTPAEKGAVKAKILMLHGADDPFVSKRQIEVFKKEMEIAGADYSFISYKGTVHAYTNPDADAYGRKFNLPLGYNAGADRQSWDEMKIFFNAIFK